MPRQDVVMSIWEVQVPNKLHQETSRDWSRGASLLRKNAYAPSPAVWGVGMSGTRAFIKRCGLRTCHPVSCTETPDSGEQ